MKSRQVFILAGVLAIIGLGLFVFKAWRLHLPLTPGTTTDQWEVEVHISFQGEAKPAKAYLFIPSIRNRYAAIDHHFISRGYGLTTQAEGSNQQVIFATRKAAGEQNIYYRFGVHDSGRATPLLKARAPELPPVLWTGAELSAAQTILQEATAHSADTQTLVSALLARLNADPASDAAHLLLGATPTLSQRLETAVGILAMAKVAARTVHGIELVLGHKNAPLVHWLEYADNGHWLSYPAQGPGVRERWLPWWRGPTSLVRVSGGDKPRANLTVAWSPHLALASVADVIKNEAPLLLKFSFFSLPMHVQQVFKVLLTVPLGVLLLVFVRNVIGLTIFGTFMPVLIALAFRETHLLWGIFLFICIVAGGLTVRLYFEHLKLLVVPRLAAILIVVILLMAGLSILSYAMGMDRGWSIALFPMVILTMTVERLSVIWDERGPAAALQQAAGSLLVAALCHLAMSNPYTEHVMFIFPELLLVILALTLLLGRYTGYRLLELKRFRALVDRP
ncbi:MAG: inactive transglutaminase family protein [Magnetococcales bacterium]|nr:inactive transglutaminase family protein [Magnetococcales bacterium]